MIAITTLQELIKLFRFLDQVVVEVLATSALHAL
jgi:hypothetical protein